MGQKACTPEPLMNTPWKANVPLYHLKNEAESRKENQENDEN